jgi:murein L,D-transpeptidase YcbB/YkuD
MKKSIWIAGISAILIIAIVLAVVFRKSLFKPSNKGYSSAKNTHEPLTDIGFPKYYRSLLTDMFSYADSLGIADDINRVSVLKTYDSLVHLPGIDAKAIRTSSGLFFTNSATQFLYNAAYGDTLDILYSGVKLTTDSTRIVNIVLKLAVNGNWQQALDSVEPSSIQYRILKSALNRINSLVKNYPSIDSVDTSSAFALRSNTILKLKAYGLINNNPERDSISDGEFSSAIYRFQKMVHIDTSGTLDKTTIVSIQFPLRKRITEIKRSLNFWRWSSRLAKQPFVLVNVAAARLTVIGDPRVKISMRVIPGKPDDKTPLFTAYFTKVTTYPYWVVPFSIETSEMLPRIQKSISYLAKNDLEVMDRQGCVLDYTSIKWNQYSKRNFPFFIRQQSGCNDALGVLQFSMNCPFDIYLHDTDIRELFGKTHRFLSHGCIRVQEPVLLAKYLLHDKFTATDSIYVSQCLKGQKPKDISMAEKIAAIVYYLTADVNEGGELRFYKDMYDMEK